MSDGTADVAIVGGGMVGMTLATALGGAGLNVVIVDAEAPAAMTAAPFDGRSSAIAFGSQQVLAGIGAWTGMAAEAQPILDNRVIRRALLQRLAELPTVRHIAPARVAGVTRTESAATLHRDGGEPIAARLVVAAVGRRSPIRTAAG